MVRAGQLDPFLAQPKQDLAHAAELVEPAEHHGDGGLHALVGVLLQPPERIELVADRNALEQLAPARLGADRSPRALAERGQLHFAERPLHAKQEPVIGQARVMNPLLIDDQAAHQGAELEQSVPVAPVARQARRLDRDDRAHRALADGRQQAFEAGPRDAGTGTAQVLVGDDHVLPAERPRPVGQAILPPLALQVVLHLVERGLADVDEGRPREVAGGDLIHRPSPPLRSGRRSASARAAGQ